MDTTAPSDAKCVLHKLINANFDFDALDGGVFVQTAKHKYYRRQRLCNNVGGLIKIYV